jgi:hypothetical protein
MRLGFFRLLCLAWSVLTTTSACASGTQALPGSVRDPRPATRLPVAGAPVGVTAFVNVAVVPMDAERVLSDQTVLVEAGRITALGPGSSRSGADRRPGQVSLAWSRRHAHAFQLFDQRNLRQHRRHESAFLVARLWRDHGPQSGSPGLRP